MNVNETMTAEVLAGEEDARREAGFIAAEYEAEYEAFCGEREAFAEWRSRYLAAPGAIYDATEWLAAQEEATMREEEARAAEREARLDQYRPLTAQEAWEEGQDDDLPF